MADKPQFIGTYRQETFLKRSAMCTRPELIFTPGVNGSRIHGMGLTNDGDVNQEIHFGEAQLVTETSVTIAAGSNPGTDPWTITRSDGGSFVADGWGAGDILSMDQSVYQTNRRDHRIINISATVLTMKAFATPFAQTLTAKLWRWNPWWRLTIPARAGHDTQPVVSALDAEVFPVLDPLSEKYLVISKPMWARLPNNDSGWNGNVMINIMGGDY